MQITQVRYKQKLTTFGELIQIESRPKQKFRQKQKFVTICPHETL